ncbi:hypothetical protein GmRootA79_16030 [Acidovorax sp. A79]|uniref:hypothetical protein n=1 Tax=Acidovorax sp. A79 TaxID=3056107 RepID=UPI0034E866EC
MIAGLYPYVAAGLVAAALASAGTWRLQEWRHGAKEAQRLELARQAEEARQTDARQQRKFNDTASGRHASAVATLNTQLGDARAQIATLSRDRQCLDARTVGMLNNLGTASSLGLRTPAGQPAGAAPAAAADTPNTGFASERDTADWIAQCKVRYGAVADQLNQILDIEERRQQGTAP